MSKQRGARLRHGLAAALLLLLSSAQGSFAQSQHLPPKPDRYVTDQAGVLDAATAETLNQQLDQFERDTSNQILVAIYPSLPEDAEIAQYSTDAYNAWQVGQKGKDNGAVLFVFVNDHKLFIVTGRGLEGALPDAICKRIITQVIVPQFKQGNYPAGIQAGIATMIAATKGEYTGNGSTVADQQSNNNGQDNEAPPWVSFVFIMAIILLSFFSHLRYRSGSFIYTGGGYGGGGFGGGGGGFSGGDSGGFSGGGGSSAGGGAGGSW